MGDVGIHQVRQSIERTAVLHVVRPFASCYAYVTFSNAS
jgi:hypothetical protein